MSARPSRSRLTGTRPGGPWKHSPGFSLGEFPRNDSPVGAEEWSVLDDSCALSGRIVGLKFQPRLKPGLCLQGPSSSVILTTANRSDRISANGGLLVQERRRAHLSASATAIIKASITDKLETVESILHYLPRSPILPAELRMLDLTTRPH
jgi:hypothetical protein